MTGVWEKEARLRFMRRCLGRAENEGELAHSTFTLHCEVSDRFAGWLGPVCAIAPTWRSSSSAGTGKGSRRRPPREIAPPARVVQVANDV